MQLRLQNSFDIYQLHKSLKVMSHTNFVQQLNVLKNVYVKNIFIFINENMSYIAMIIDLLIKFVVFFSRFKHKDMLMGSFLVKS